MDKWLQISLELLARGLKIRFQAKGSSMRPYIQDGDVLEIEPVSSLSAVRVGDTVFTCTQGKVAIHRVVKKVKTDKWYLLTKGDALDFPDSPIASEAVYGRVVAINRNGACFKLTGKLRHLQNVIIAKVSFYFPKWLRLCRQAEKLLEVSRLWKLLKQLT